VPSNVLSSIAIAVVVLEAFELNLSVPEPGSDIVVVEENV
jgi:hypothetical protein